MLKNKVIYTAACFKSLLRDFRRVLIADHRIEGCYHADTVVNVCAATVGIRRDSVDAAGAECIETVDHDMSGLEIALGCYRLHGVELELCGFGSECDAGVVALYGF